MLEIKPLHSNVVIKREKPQETLSKGGIIIPEKVDKQQDKPDVATVVAVGGGIVRADGTTEKIKLKAGDQVLVSQFAGSKVRLSDDDSDIYFVVPYRDILGVVK